MIRKLETSEIRQIIFTLEEYENGLTFQYASSILDIPMKTLSPLMKDLVHFGFLTQKGRIYIPNKDNIQLWIKYDCCLDYQVLSKSDKAFNKFTTKGIRINLGFDDDG